MWLFNIGKKRVSIDFKDLSVSIMTVNASSALTSQSANSNKLLFHLKNKAWDRALKRLSKKTTDMRDGDLFLQIALSNKAPLDVVQALHKARPEAVMVRDPDHEMLPLHMACEHGLPLEVVEYLHKQYPDAARETCDNQMLPLHLAILSNACRRPVICYLLASFPEGMLLKDSKNMTALEYLEHSGHPHSAIIMREFERGESFWAAKDLHDPSGNGISLLICQQKWDKILDRIMQYPEEATVWTIYKGKRMLPIHYACKYHAPDYVISELADLHPFGLSLTCQEYDMTALHLACEHGCPFNIIRTLLQAHADAASYKDELGLLPLHLACAHGASVNVIEALVKVYPDAVNVIDAKGYTPKVYAEAAPFPHSKTILGKLLSADSSSELSTQSSSARSRSFRNKSFAEDPIKDIQPQTLTQDSVKDTLSESVAQEPTEDGQGKDDSKPESVAEDLVRDVKQIECRTEDVI